MEILIAVTLAAFAQFSRTEPGGVAGVSPREWGIFLQQTDPAKEIEFFSGEVVESASDRIEVVRSTLGKSETRRFSVTEETKFEGTPKKGSRVTVGYNAKSPDVAIRVIVRDGEP